MKQLKLLFLTTTFLFFSFTFVAEGGICASKPIKAEEELNPEATDETTVSGSGVAPSSGEEDTCPLCLEKHKDAAMVSPCGHIFCLECLKEVAKTFKQCPRCRGELRKIIRIPVQQRVVMAKLYELLPDGARKDDAIASLNNHPSNWVGVRKVSEEGFILQLDLSQNQLTGEIPPELGQLTELRLLNLTHNQLTGAIPRELGQLTELRLLNLTHNQLTGAIPRELGQLTQLIWLNLTHNQLTGPTPSEIIKNRTYVSR